MFPFKYEKTLQAVAYLLRREPSRQMNYMRLIKVLYMADRQSIQERGQPITGDHVVAMERGPVLSQLLDLVKGIDLRAPEWSKYIQRQEFNVQLVTDPRNDRLSRYEIELLEKVAQQHRMRDEWAMVDLTHTLPEWLKNNPGKSVKDIPLADILEAVGRSDDLETIEEDAKADAAFASVFGA